MWTEEGPRKDGERTEKGPKLWNDNCPIEIQSHKSLDFEVTMKYDLISDS